MGEVAVLVQRRPAPRRESAGSATPLRRAISSSVPAPGRCPPGARAARSSGTSRHRLWPPDGTGRGAGASQQHEYQGRGCQGRILAVFMCRAPVRRRTAADRVQHGCLRRRPRARPVREHERRRASPPPAVHGVADAAPGPAAGRRAAVRGRPEHHLHRPSHRRRARRERRGRQGGRMRRPRQAATPPASSHGQPGPAPAAAAGQPDAEDPGRGLPRHAAAAGRARHADVAEPAVHGRHPAGGRREQPGHLGCRTPSPSCGRCCTGPEAVTGLLQVQKQITSDESDLEALLAQQRALDHETSYATVSMLLLGPAAARRCGCAAVTTRFPGRPGCGLARARARRRVAGDRAGAAPAVRSSCSRCSAAWATRLAPVARRRTRPTETA